MICCEKCGAESEQNLCKDCRPLLIQAPEATDFDIITSILSRRGLPYFCYSGIDNRGAYRVMVLDEDRDASREVALLIFDCDTNQLIQTGTRELNP